VSDPALIAISQTSVELDAVFIPFNRKSKHKEPQHWMQELRHQGISHVVLGCLGRNITEAGQDTARAKKAVTCLYYVSGMGTEDIERAISQFVRCFRRNRRVRSGRSRAAHAMSCR
jgi:predicted HAD superfamily phosphohydrolase YqeG